MTTSAYDSHFNVLNQSEYADQLPANMRMSYKEFTQSTESPAGLALIFEAAYERSQDTPSMRDERAAAAEEWYEYFKDFD